MQIPSSTLPNTSTDTNPAGTGAAPQVAAAVVNGAVQSNIQLGTGALEQQGGITQPTGMEWNGGIRIGIPMLPTPYYPVPAAIDRWLADSGLNQYGDPMGVCYPGGSPLFNMQTGERVSRLEYILRQHPQLKVFLPKNHPLQYIGTQQPFPMPQLPYFPGSQQVQQMLQQLLQMLSGLIGSLFQPKPPSPPSPLPPGIGLPGLPGSQWQLREQIGQVRRDIREVKSQIRIYEKMGQPVPRHLQSRLKFLERRLEKLQAQLQFVLRPPMLRALSGQDSTGLATNGTQQPTAAVQPTAVSAAEPATSQPKVNS